MSSLTLFGQGSLTPPGPPGPGMASLADIKEDLSLLTNDFSAVKEIGLCVSAITNALQGLDWVDILDIRHHVHRLTNEHDLIMGELGSGRIRDIQDSLAWTTHALWGLAGLDVIAGQLIWIFSEITNSLEAIQADIDEQSTQSQSLQASAAQITLMLSNVLDRLPAAP